MSTNKPNMVEYTCGPSSCKGDLLRWIKIQASLSKNVTPYLKNNKIKNKHKKD
jgi:hypothetical protein